MFCWSSASFETPYAHVPHSSKFQTPQNFTKLWTNFLMISCNGIPAMWHRFYIDRLQQIENPNLHTSCNFILRLSGWWTATINPCGAGGELGCSMEEALRGHGRCGNKTTGSLFLQYTHSLSYWHQPVQEGIRLHNYEVASFFKNYP